MELIHFLHTREMSGLGYQNSSLCQKDTVHDDECTVLTISLFFSNKTFWLLKLFEQFSVALMLNVLHQNIIGLTYNYTLFGLTEEMETTCLLTSYELYSLPLHDNLFF